ncbi:Aste57867_9909 [Aphanomyces stellatus]|uniref:Aste57867_9909 protein n=1 Tax=Aphanomyces stellatus TaxID=120398 RepID=A0A485KPS1_9STRA|nr:hypothetical protein As57867_009870 [Aphanomyces stellatus]VFT86788.1 Aste57867_9909 [Aphanomyces stellatus]
MKSTAIASALFFAAVSAQTDEQKATLVCVNNVQTALALAVMSPNSAACAKDAGFSLTSTDVSDAALAKYVASTACQSWYKTDVVGALAKITPPCEFPKGLDGKSAPLSTAKFDLTFADFAKWIQTTAGAASSSNATKPTTTAKAGSANSTTTSNSTAANSTTVSPSGNSTGMATASPATTSAATTAAPATTAKSSSVVATVSAAALVAIAAMYA